MGEAAAQQEPLPSKEEGQAQAQPVAQLAEEAAEEEAAEGPEHLLYRQDLTSDRSQR